MKNKRLIQKIYEICLTADYREDGHVVPEVIIDLINEKAPATVAYTLRDDWKNPAQKHDNDC